MYKADKPKTILIVEDNDDDFEATERAFRMDKDFAGVIHRCEDGASALDFLLRRNKNEGSTTEEPHIVLLDLNMPGIDGRDVVKEIKSNASLRHIPVIIMTTSNDDRDIQKCYDMGANSYVVKPLDWKRFTEAVDRLKEYWFNVAVLPDPVK